MRDAGGELVAIAPQSREKNVEVVTRHGLTFPVLTDPGNRYARQLELVYRVPDDLQARYLQWGIDVPAHNGDDSWELPLATRIIVDREGVVRQVDADADYTRRPEPESGLEIIRELV